MRSKNNLFAVVNATVVSIFTNHNQFIKKYPRYAK